MIYGANATISLYKLAHGSKTSTYPLTPTVAGVEAYIESKQSDLVQVLGEQSNIEVFDMFIEPIDVNVGDKVIDDKGREYRITGLERHENNMDTDDMIRVTMNSRQI